MIEPKPKNNRLGRTAVVAATVLALGMAALPSAADHGLPHPVLLGRGTFFDDVSAMFKVKIPGEGTQVIHLKDASDMVVLQIGIEAGGIAPWHTHSGTGLLINLGPGTLTNVVGDDCVPRLFYPGDAFVDTGHGELHAVRNDSDQDLTLLAVFFGIDAGGPPVIPTPGGPEECGFLP